MTENLNSDTATNGCTNGKTAGVQIAVFLDKNKLPAAPHEADRVVFYASRKGKWVQTETRSIRPPHDASPDLVKAFIEDIASFVLDVQAVAGASVAGIAYTVFNRQGQHVFEISDISAGHLNGIAEDIAMAEARQKLTADVFTCVLPTETEISGVYSLDLVTALELYPELSSKMILKPFLKSTPFTELTIICRHIPPWLPMETALTITKKQREENLVVTVKTDL